MISSVQILVRILDEAFEKKSWHGTNLKGSVRGLTVHEASWRPADDRHSIREHVLHCAYWKYTVWRRLTGAKRGTFPLKGSNWFARSVDSFGNESEWQKELLLLSEVHQSLRTAIAALKPGQLEQPADGGETSVLSLVTGIAAHDLYHAGQIQLLKKLMGYSRSRGD